MQRVLSIPERSVTQAGFTPDETSDTRVGNAEKPIRGDTRSDDSLVSERLLPEDGHAVHGCCLIHSQVLTYECGFWVHLRRIFLQSITKADETEPMAPTEILLASDYVDARGAGRITFGGRAWPRLANAPFRIVPCSATYRLQMRAYASPFCSQSIVTACTYTVNPGTTQFRDTPAELPPHSTDTMMMSSRTAHDQIRQQPVESRAPMTQRIPHPFPSPMGDRRLPSPHETCDLLPLTNARESISSSHTLK